MTASPVSNGPGPGRGSGEQRRRALLRWSITVAIAAVLIIAIGTIGPALLGQRGSKQASVSSAAFQRSEQLRAQAEAAAASGDVQAARALAQSAVEADPANTAAQALVTRLSAAGGTTAPPATTPTGTPTPGGSGSTTTTPTAPKTSPDEGYTQPIADLASLLPTAFPGWSFDRSIAVGDEVSISASPASASSAGRLLWTIRDRETVERAKSFVTKTSKSLYGKNAATVTVHGVSAYYGTDGSRLATVTYTRGRFVFELIFPSALGRAKGVSAAAAFKDSPVR